MLLFLSHVLATRKSKIARRGANGRESTILTTKIWHLPRGQNHATCDVLDDWMPSDVYGRPSEPTGTTEKVIKFLCEFPGQEPHGKHCLGTVAEDLSAAHAISCSSPSLTSARYTSPKACDLRLDLKPIRLLMAVLLCAFSR